MVPCTGVAPACTAARTLATAQSASLCVWMPTATPPPSPAITSAVASATWWGSEDPLVSHSTTVSAPAPWPRELLKQPVPFGMGGGEARLDQVDAQLVETVTAARLLGRRQRHPL